MALEESLGALQTRTQPLVERLDRRPGQKEYRYRQLFAAEDGEAHGSPEVGPASMVGESEPEMLELGESSVSDVEALRVRIEAVEQRLDQLLRELGIVAPGSELEDAGDL
jgi:uncharacterized protein YceH (UPF0502 family)